MQTTSHWFHKPVAIDVKSGGESNSYNIFIKIYELAVQFSPMPESGPELAR